MQSAQLPNGELVLFGDDVAPEQMDMVVQQKLGQSPAPSMQEQRNGLLGEGVEVLKGIAQMLKAQALLAESQTQVLTDIAMRMDVLTAQVGNSSDKVFAGLTAKKALIKDGDGKTTGIQTFTGDVNE
jgi:hypothetical protein